MPKPQSKRTPKPSLNSSVFCFDADDKQAKYCFKAQPIELKAAAENKQRTFSGVAYSGEVITDHWAWDRVIFDLDTIAVKGRIPALLDHSSSQRVGAINEYQIDHATGLTVSGTLLSNEFGAMVARESDEGFPWQMSVRIEPAEVEEVKTGKATVNGKTYQAPITIFRGGRIREVSFCALGADDNTNAVAASYQPNTFKPEDTTVTELEQAQAKIAELEAKNSELETQNQQFAADKRDAEIAALATELGSEFSAEDAAEYAQLDDKAFAFTAKQLRAAKAKFAAAPAKPKLPDHLFSHQATQGRDEQNTKPSLSEMAKNY